VLLLLLKLTFVYKYKNDKYIHKALASSPSTFLSFFYRLHTSLFDNFLLYKTYFRTKICIVNNNIRILENSFFFFFLRFDAAANDDENIIFEQHLLELFKILKFPFFFLFCDVEIRHRTDETITIKESSRKGLLLSNLK
jgi:hypothetical protein